MMKGGERMNKKGQSELGTFVGVAFLIALIIGAIIGTAFLLKSAGPWWAGKTGQSELARAEQNRQIAILEAQAKLDSSKKLAEKLGVSRSQERRYFANVKNLMSGKQIVKKVSRIPTEKIKPLARNRKIKFTKDTLLKGVKGITKPKDVFSSKFTDQINEARKTLGENLNGFFVKINVSVFLKNGQEYTYWRSFISDRRKNASQLKKICLLHIETYVKELPSVSSYVVNEINIQIMERNVENPTQA